METCDKCGGVVDDDDYDCPHCGEIIKSVYDLPVPEPKEDDGKEQGFQWI